ncbi:MAG: bifunctional 3,4-dihydroxy-2-butanone 4-phosphate synthase/GTP cyclohydrolase II [Gammaproteobacteria bacterium RIFCSPHIGHO2_12_FULL_42_10]|nr:MAG: bifunctional 3,4-dihydroxy-2-butanone 4-phosphate synthase/GTP cyclohydrolase II [Gammaproteobacteria bacterium RIFCSPHIGHO2_12_FULL_42_10]
MQLPASIKRVNTAIQTLKNGSMVVLLDHPDRENEGDLIMPAETITPEQMNFMIQHCSGIVCLPMMPDRLKKLNLDLMVPPHHNTSRYHTPFTVSIDARKSITTGVSAQDRVNTIRVAINERTVPDDLVRPGHIFPLQVRTGGTLERPGHTEGSVDLVKLAGFNPAAVLCEIMNKDGTMAKQSQLNRFAKKYHLPILYIEDIIEYRLRHESMIEDIAVSSFPLEKYGSFKISVIKEKISGAEHIVLTKPHKNQSKPTLVRIHSTCATGDLFASRRCDCHQQLHHALAAISEEGGMLIYLNQEGRGIGLFNKIKAYTLQEKGLDTVEANLELGLPIDSRKYYIAAHILRHYKIDHIRLLTNNPEKMADLYKYGISRINQVLMPAFHNEDNQHYLNTKKTKLKHAIHFKQGRKVET